MSEELRLDPEHHYFLGERRLPGVTEILDAHGLISPFAKQERARLRGSLAHLACRYLMERRLDWSTIGMDVVPYVVSCDRWLEETRFEVEACEVMDYHRELLYAGTYDFRGLHPKLGPMLLDLKSGVPEGWHPWQLAGYAGIAGLHLYRGGLYLQKDGSRARFVPYRDRMDWPKFCAALTVYRMKEAA